MRRRQSDPAPRFAGRRFAWLALALAGLVGLIAPVVVSAGSPQGAPLQLAPAELNAGQPQGDYVIGPEDKLRIRVFQVKDMSFDDEQVDASGDIELPLIGKVTAAGLTTEQLEQELARRLGERYLQSPQVSVSVTEGASQKVTVEGDGRRPGRPGRPAQGGGDPRAERRPQGGGLRLRRHPQGPRGRSGHRRQRRRGRRRIGREDDLGQHDEDAADVLPARIPALVCWI
jgi:protein involved in polysaccharide export with SLBB domain